MGSRKTSGKQRRTSRGESVGKPLSAGRRWLFRVVALVVVPLLFFLVIEIGLRVTGFGYETDFLIKEQRNGQEWLVSNPRFGWRYFGEKLARKPVDFSISAAKPHGVIRLVVFGESAAYGDPNPDFGLPRMLETVLSKRHPGTRFEVVNAAMTGINSHAIREIAHDCLAADADAWIIYMGNNEVVGPYGAGTVFGPTTPPLPMIRASLALKKTRTGQLLDRWRESFGKSSESETEWGGMAMFTGNQVAENDARLPRVYDHFESNLSEIVNLAKRHEIPAILSTVAVNLRDSAPFASTPSKLLTDSEQARWLQHFNDAQTQLNNGDRASAIASLQAAAKLDENVADLRFLLGRALETSDVALARKHFERARDLDLLRFRCDSSLNEITRSIAARNSDTVRLVDAAGTLVTHGVIPGSEHFYEHVHLTFEGNHRLAILLAQQVESALHERMPTDAVAAWPSVDDCARALAWIAPTRQSTLADVLIRLSDPPFTEQLTHSEQIAHVREQLTMIAAEMADPQSVHKALDTTRAAVANRPEDHTLRSLLSWLLLQTGDAEAALAEADRAIELLPNGADKHFQRAIILGQLQRHGDAAETLRTGLELDPTNVWAINDLANALRKTSNDRDALAKYRQAIEINPRFGLAYLGIGELLEKQGDKSGAEEHFKRAFENPVNKKSAAVQLARFFHARKRFEEAATCYQRALKMDALDASNHLGAGQCLAALGRDAEAARHFEAFAQLSPNSPEARFLLGLQLANQGNSLGAVSHFAEAVRMKPSFTEAHINLASSLRSMGNIEEALVHYREALRLQPGNPVAIRSIAEIEAAQKSE